MKFRHTAPTLQRMLAAALLTCLAALPAGCGSSSPSSGAPPAPADTATAVAAATGPWPTPQDQTYQGCPPGGDGGDHALNIRKNRIDSGSWQPSTVAAIVNLPYPQSVARQPRTNWSADDAAAVARSEGRPLQIEGYLLLVRHQGTESTNCHDADARDFHMWLADRPGTAADRATALIAEVAPRSRALNAGWQPNSRLLGLTGHHVRLSGWLMLDQEHPEQIGKTRGTLWEIHPVMKIEVEQGGRWIDLNDPSLTISGGPPDSAPGPDSDSPVATSPRNPARGGTHQARPTHTPSAGTHHRRQHATPTPGGTTHHRRRRATPTPSGDG